MAGLSGAATLSPSAKNWRRQGREMSATAKGGDIISAIWPTRWESTYYPNEGVTVGFVSTPVLSRSAINVGACLWQFG